MDDELQLHVAHTGSSENHFHDSDFVEHETVYGYAVAAIGSDGAEGAASDEVEITTPDAPGEAPDEIEGVSLESVEGDVKITWSSLNNDTITDFHISRTSEDHVEAETGSISRTPTTRRSSTSITTGWRKERPTSTRSARRTSTAWARTQTRRA